MKVRQSNRIHLQLARQKHNRRGLLNLLASLSPVAVAVTLLVAGFALASSRIEEAHAAGAPCTAPGGLNISTGTQDPVTGYDAIWNVTSAPPVTAFPLPHAATYVTPSGTGSTLPVWVTPPPGTNWIDPYNTGFNAPDPVGTTAYDTTFTVPPAMQSFTLDFDFASDDGVTFRLFAPPPSSVPLTGDVGYFPTFGIGQISPNSYQQLWHVNQTVAAPAPGTWTLRANVTNDSGPTGLLVHGTVTCTPAPCAASGGLNISTGTNGPVVDPIWNLVGPLPAYGVASPIWLASAPGASWINASGTNSSQSLLTYVYETKFFVPANANLKLDFKFAADNGVSFDLTGPLGFTAMNAFTGLDVDILYGPSSNWHALHPPFPPSTPIGSTPPPFTLANVPGGTYTLTATVTNPDAPTPSALLVAGTVNCGISPVGGVATLTVSSSGSSVPWTPLAAVAAGVMAVLAVGGWYGRRRWLR